MNSKLSADYERLTNQAGLVDLGDWTQVEMIGEDRVTFLHNMCTNDIRALTPGSGCEAFITSAQGKTLGHVFVFCSESSLCLLCAPGQADTLITHLDRYVIREDVQFADRTAEWTNLLLAGNTASSVLGKTCEATPPDEQLAHTTATMAGHCVQLRQFNLGTTAAWWIVAESDVQAEIVQELTAHGVALCDQPAFEALRIESGLPLFGSDITSDNLPQEVNRDSLAISFTKGCYIGQETVARLDAMGHVNKQLAGVRFSNDAIPQPGMELTANDKPIAVVTSAAWSPKMSAPLAMIFVRKEQSKPGTRLDSPVGEAEVW